MGAAVSRSSSSQPQQQAGSSSKERPRRLTFVAPPATFKPSTPPNATPTPEPLKPPETPLSPSPKPKGLRIKENKEVYEGEVTELTPEYTEAEVGGAGRDGAGGVYRSVSPSGASRRRPRPAHGPLATKLPQKECISTEATRHQNKTLKPASPKTPPTEP
jgi:hypothetical protein